MKNTLVVSLSILAFLTLPLLAQEKEMGEESMQSMTPPMPLNDDLTKWMVGEWEGWTEAPMGKMQDWQKIEMGLDNQFLLITYKSKMSSMTPEHKKTAAEHMNMSVEEAEKMMIQFVYKGHGMITIDPMTDEFVGYWFDNWRGTYKGTGKREGDKIAWTWVGPMGTSERTTEKVSEDRMVETFKEKDPSGNVMEGRSEWTRKKE